MDVFGIGSVTYANYLLATYVSYIVYLSGLAGISFLSWLKKKLIHTLSFC